MEEVIVGIDPDTDKSGVAAFHKDGRVLFVDSLTFPNLLEYIQRISYTNDQPIMELLKQDVTYVVENSWGTSHNWHAQSLQPTRQNLSRVAQIGNRTGRAHEVGRKIVEMINHYGYKCIEQSPLKLIWGANRKSKIGQRQFIELMELNKITLARYDGSEGKKVRTNQEERDAALIALHISNIPMKMKL